MNSANYPNELHRLVYVHGAIKSVPNTSGKRDPVWHITILLRIFGHGHTYNKHTIEHHRSVSDGARTKGKIKYSKPLCVDVY